MNDADKKVAREKLAQGYIPAWAEFAERQLGDGPFFGGAKLQVIDLKLFMTVGWLTGGRLDHVPATILQPFPKLNRVHQAVRDHAGVRSWYARG
jgi:glutathione S-transferase